MPYLVRGVFLEIVYIYCSVELKEEAHEYYAWCFSTVKCISIEVLCFLLFYLKMDFEIEVVTTLVKKIVDS